MNFRKKDQYFKRNNLLFFSGLAESEIYNPFTKLRTGRRLNNGDSNDAVTTQPHLFLNDDNLKFSTTLKPSTTAVEMSASNRLTHFDTLFNNQSFLNQSSALISASLNRPKIRSTQLNGVDSKARSSSNDESPNSERSQNNLFMDNDMYGGLFQLISSTLKASRSPINSPNNNQPINLNNQLSPQNLINNPNLKPLLMNNPHLLNNLLNKMPNRININNNRLPNGASSLNKIQNVLPPTGFIVGPSNRPPSLPLHFAKPQSNRPLTNNNNPSINLNAQQQFNNQLLNQLLKPGAASQLNITSLPINNFLNNMIANNQSFDQLLPNGLLNTNSSKNYIKVEQAEVSRLLLGLNSKSTMRNEVLSSTQSTNSASNDDSLNSIDSLHFPNELFARTSINRTLNENQILNTNFLNANKPTSINPTRPFDTLYTTKLADKIDHLFELTNATVISNNHYGNRFNRTQLTSSFSSIGTSPLSIDNTAPLNTNKISINSINQSNNNNGAVISTTVWKPFDKFEMFNTNNNLIKPTRTVWEVDNAPDIITKPDEASTFDVTVRNRIGANESRIDLMAENIKPTFVAGLHESSATTAFISPSSKEPSEEIVYGRPANRPNNNADSQLRPGVVNSVNPSTTQATITSVTLNKNFNNNQKATPSLPTNEDHDSIGRPLVYPVEMDLVKPQVATNQLPGSVSIITESGGGSVYIDAQQKHFKLKPVQKTSTIPPMQIGSTMNVYGSGSNLDNQNKPGSSLSSSNPINPFNSLNTTSNIEKTNRINQIRRPVFRPKPAVPLVRIDTCIVGDDSTCGVNLNEHCKTEAGISSCQCKPGEF